MVARGAALLCAVVLGACSGGETANTTPRSESDAEAADTMSGSGSECVEVARQPIALDEQSPLGFKPAEALESLAQPQAAPLRWAPEDVGVSFGPEAGDDTITLSVTPTGTVEWVEYEPADQPDRATAMCPGQVQAPASVRVVTAGGVLDEVFDTVLDLDAPTSVQVLHQLDGTTLRGSLTFSAEAPAEGKATIEVNALMTRYGTAGALDVQFQNGSSAMGTGLASWPLDNPCDMGTRALFPVPLNGQAGSPDIATGSDAVALAQSVKTAELTWPNGTQETANLCIEPTASLVCARLDPAGGFDLWTTLALSTSDGSLSQRYGANISVDSSDASTVHLTLNDPCNMQRMPIADFIQTCGDWGVDLTGYAQARMDVDAQIDLAASNTGAITILGTTPFSCPDGQRCEPYEETEIARVTLGDIGVD